MKKILVTICCWLLLVTPILGGAAYDFGDQHIFTWTVLDPTTQVPVTPTAITITIYRGAGTQVVAATPMTALSTGHYYYAYTVPSTAGDYWAVVDWTISATNYGQALPPIKVKDINETPPTATAIYTEFTSGTNEDQFKADISALASQASVDAIPTATETYAEFIAGSNEDAFKAVGFSTHSPSDIWNLAQSGFGTPGTFGFYLDAAISSVGGGAAPSAAEISDSVLNKAMAPFSIAGTFGKLVNDNLDAAVSTRSTFDVITETVNLGAISGDPLAADSLEAMLDGTGTTLFLRQFRVEAIDGNKSAVVITGNGAGHGIYAIGGALGDGIRTAGGATSGNGLYALANTNGQGILARGGASAGNGFQTEALANGNGIRALGFGTMSGFYAQGGATGPGAYFRGGLTGGTAANGLTLYSGPDGGNGLSATGFGVGNGIYAVAEDSGSGGYFLGGDNTLGSATTNSSGLYVRGRDDDGIYIAAGSKDNKHAIEARGGTGAGGDAIRILGLGPSGVAVSATSASSTIYTSVLRDELANAFWNIPFNTAFGAGTFGDSLNNATYVQGEASGLDAATVESLIKQYYDSTLMMLTLYPGSKSYVHEDANMDTVYTVGPSGDTIAVQVYLRIGKQQWQSPDSTLAVEPPQ